MTVEAQNVDGSPIVRSGPYSGNGVTTVFSYGFPITQDSEVRVVRQNADLTEDTLALTTGYTVQNAGDPSGGSITLLDAATLPTGAKLVLLLDMAFDQPNAYSNQGRIKLELLEVSLDKLTLITRQLREELLRAVTVDAFNTTDIAALRTNIAALGLIEAEIATVAGAIASVTAVAGISASVATVAGIAAAVSTVAGIAAAVSTVSTNIAAVNTNATNIVAIQGAAAAAAAAAVSAGQAAASAALAATFDPALYVTKANFLADVAANVVTAAETIAANDNDTTIPTSAAVIDYVENSWVTVASRNQEPGPPITTPIAVTFDAGYDYRVTARYASRSDAVGIPFVFTVDGGSHTLTVPLGAAASLYNLVMNIPNPNDTANNIFVVDYGVTVNTNAAGTVVNNQRWLSAGDSLRINNGGNCVCTALSITMTNSDDGLFVVQRRRRT